MNIKNRVNKKQNDLKAFCFSLLLMVFFFTEFVSGAGNVQVFADKSSQNQITYKSSDTVYVEALVEGQWVTRSWSAEGSINETDIFGISPAFEIYLRLVVHVKISP